MRRSFSSISTSTSSGSSGQTYTDANDVCRRAAWSNGEMRTRRWTPASAEQQAVGVVADDDQRRALDARFVARLEVDDLALEAAALGPAQVHPQQHLGPVLRLGAAGARMDRDDGVLAIVLAAEHLLGLAGVDFARKIVEAAAEIVGDRLARLGPFDEHARDRRRGASATR